MPAQTIPAHAVGDVVHLLPEARRPGEGDPLFVVTAIPGGSRRRLAVDPVEGGRGIAGAPELFERVDSDTAARARARMAELAAAGGRVTLGSVVVFTSPTREAQRGLFVAIKADGGRATVVPLGGSESVAGFRGVSFQMLRVVPITDAARAALQS